MDAEDADDVEGNNRSSVFVVVGLLVPLDDVSHTDNPLSSREPTEHTELSDRILLDGCPSKKDSCSSLITFNLPFSSLLREALLSG